MQVKSGRFRRRPITVMDPKYCPLCDEPMRLVTREEINPIPGTSEVKRRKVNEWQCPECEHFQEADPEEGERA